MEKCGLVFEKWGNIPLLVYINIMKNLQLAVDHHSRKKKHNHQEKFEEKIALRYTFLQKTFP